jgi:hypothetical protein
MNRGALSFDPSTWEAVLGPRPESSGGYSPTESASWPDESEGPVSGVFWLRYIADRLQEVGATPSAAKALRSSIRERLHSGTLQAVAVHPSSGQARRVLPSEWDATPGSRGLWWTGQKLGGAESDLLCAVYLLEQAPPPPPPPKWWPAPEETLKHWCTPDGLADREARARLAARTASASERAIGRELSFMWRKAGRTGGSPATIENTRRKLR